MRAAIAAALICAGLALGGCELGMAVTNLALVPFGNDLNCNSGGYGGCGHAMANCYPYPDVKVDQPCPQDAPKRRPKR